MSNQRYTVTEPDSYSRVIPGDVVYHFDGERFA